MSLPSPPYGRQPLGRWTPGHRQEDAAAVVFPAVVVSATPGAVTLSAGSAPAVAAVVLTAGLGAVTISTPGQSAREPLGRWIPGARDRPYVAPQYIQGVALQSGVGMTGLSMGQPIPVASLAVAVRAEPLLTVTMGQSPPVATARGALSATPILYSATHTLAVGSAAGMSKAAIAFSMGQPTPVAPVALQTGLGAVALSMGGAPVVSPAPLSIGLGPVALVMGQSPPVASAAGSLKASPQMSLSFGMTIEVAPIVGSLGVSRPVVTYYNRRRLSTFGAALKTAA